MRAEIRDEKRDGSVAAELYEPPGEVWPRIRDSEPPGLHGGPVELEDGQRVEGKLSETELAVVPEVVEIGHHRSWRAHLVSR